MRSHIARNACRASLRPVVRHSIHPKPALPAPLLCLRDQHLQRLLPGCNRAAPALVERLERRTFFGPFKKPPREVQDAQIIPGYDTLLEFTAAEKDNVRPPELPELLKAVSIFFESLDRRASSMNSTQARCALRTLLYLQNNYRPSDPTQERWAGLSLSKLRVILRVISRPRNLDEAQHHLELAKLVYLGSNRLLGNKDKEPLYFRRTYFKCLLEHGSTSLVCEEFVNHLREQPSGMSEDMVKTSISVLYRLARQGEQAAFLELADLLEARGLRNYPVYVDLRVFFHAHCGQEEEALRWISQSSDIPGFHSSAALVEIADKRPDLSARVNEIFERVCDQPTPVPKSVWHGVLLWAVFVQHQDLDELTTLIRRLAKDPDAHLQDYLQEELYNLLKAAVDRENYVLAERIMEWVKTQGHVKICASATALQLEWRLAANDLQGAHKAYETIIHGELATEMKHNQVQGPALNKYLRMLCSRGPPHSDKLLSVLSALEEQQTNLEPETVASLARYFLENDLEYELIDTLSIHALHFSIAERVGVVNNMVDFCLDKSRSTARVWNAYSLLRQYFPEMKRATRVQLMEAFFARKRPDMGVVVFGHMRAHENPEIRPNADVYVAALESLGRFPDLDSLKLVHNMFKMDTYIQPSTRLYNALMMAYTGCGEPSISLEFWREISNSPEGPTYESLALFFWACENATFGADKAKEVWAKLVRMNVDIPLTVFSAYCGAIASTASLETVKKLLLGMDETVGYYPDAATLRISYDALPNQELQDEFEEFAKTRFPDTWNELVTAIPRKQSMELVRSKFVHSRAQDLMA